MTTDFGKSTGRCCFLVALMSVLLLVNPAQTRAADKAAGGEDSATKLAKETQNPVANLITTRRSPRSRNGGPLPLRERPVI